MAAGSLLARAGAVLAGAGRSQLAALELALGQQTALLLSMEALTMPLQAANTAYQACLGEKALDPPNCGCGTAPACTDCSTLFITWDTLNQTNIDLQNQYNTVTQSIPGIDQTIGDYSDIISQAHSMYAHWLEQDCDWF